MGFNPFSYFGFPNLSGCDCYKCKQWTRTVNLTLIVLLSICIGIYVIVLLCFWAIKFKVLYIPCALIPFFCLFFKWSSQVAAKKQTFSTFDELLQNSDKPVLVDFYATWWFTFCLYSSSTLVVKDVMNGNCMQSS